MGVTITSWRKYDVYYGKIRTWADPDEVQYIVKMGDHEVCLVKFERECEDILYLNGTEIARENLWNEDEDSKYARRMFDELTGYYPWQFDDMLAEMSTKKRIKYHKVVCDKTRPARHITR